MRIVDDPEMRAVMSDVRRMERQLPPLVEDYARLERITGTGRLSLKDLRVVGHGQPPPVDATPKSVTPAPAPLLDPLPDEIPWSNRMTLYEGGTGLFDGEVHTIRYDREHASFFPCSCGQPLHFEGYAIRHGEGPQLPETKAA